LIGHVCALEAREMFQKIPSVPRRTFWPRFVSQCMWKAWWSLALHCKGLAAAAAYWPGWGQIQLGLEQEVSFPSCKDFLTALWIRGAHFDLTHIRATYYCVPSNDHLRSLGSSRVHHKAALSVMTQHLFPSVASAWLNWGLQEAHATWRLEIQHLLLSISLMSQSKESMNLLIEFSLWMPQFKTHISIKI